MSTVATVQLRRHGRLEPPEAARDLWTVSVDAGDAAIGVWTADDGGYRVARYSPRPSTVWRLGGDVPAELVQMLPDGRLVTAARRLDRAEFAHQAVVHGADGTLAGAGDLGHDIRYLLADGHGQVWAGYGDEGVFEAPDQEQPEPPNRSGLACFDGALRPTWTFPRDEADEPIDDCYALNVTDDAIWVYYYSGFPIARIADGRITSWETEIEGAYALAIAPSGDQACLVGDYDDPTSVVVGDLAHGVFMARRTIRLVADGIEVTDDTATVVARGPRLHVLVGPNWYVADLDQLT